MRAGEPKVIRVTDDLRKSARPELRNVGPVVGRILGVVYAVDPTTVVMATHGLPGTVTASLIGPQASVTRNVGNGRIRGRGRVGRGTAGTLVVSLVADRRVMVVRKMGTEGNAEVAAVPARRAGADGRGQTRAGGKPMGVARTGRT